MGDGLFADPLQDASGDNFGTLLPGGGHDHDELFTPIPGYQIAWTVHDLLQCPCDLLQGMISGRMTVGIVVPLEVVHVDHHQRQPMRLPPGPFPLSVQRLVEEPSVGEPRQRIPACLALEFGLRVPLQRDVLQRLDGTDDLAF